MTAAHLDHDELADLAEGLLDDDTAVSAQRHLSTCPDCRDRAAEVANVSRVLAEAPTPPMPTHLVDRLDAVIAAEVAAHLPERRHARRHQVIAAAAAAVVVVGGGGIVANNALQDGDSSTAVGSQPRVDDPSLKGRGIQSQAALGYPVLTSGTRYTSANLASQAKSQLDRVLRQKSLRADAAGADGLEACVNAVARGQRVLLADSAAYDGKQATIVVAAAAGDARYADIWVVGPNCSAGGATPVAHRFVIR